MLAKLTPTGSLRQESVDEWELASEAESAQTYGLDEEEEKSVSDWAPEVLAAAAISRAVTDRDEEKHLEELGGIPEWLAEPEPGPEATPVGAASVQPVIEEPPVIEPGLVKTHSGVHPVDTDGAFPHGIALCIIVLEGPRHVQRRIPAVDGGGHR